jgi:LacI family transcriptional regulator
VAVPANKTGRPTLAMVAEAAGVTTPTVSKVLNGRPDVAAETRARVQQALRDYDYVPPATRSFKLHSRTVELVFSDYRNPYFGEILHGVTEQASTAGIDVVVGRPMDSGRAWARRMVRGAREGAIVVTSELGPDQLRAFQAAGRSLVVIDPINMPKIDIPSIGATNWAGGLSAAQHLIDLGHRRIAFVGGPANTACSQARLHGYRAALENNGLPFDPALVSQGGFNHENGYQRAERLLSMPKPPTAVFAACDPIAFGVMEMARLRGLSVPDDLSVVGFDDTYVSSWSCPPLTTVHQPLQEMGRAAVRVLLTLTDGSAPDTHHVELATHLVVRSSTAAPRSQT